MKNWVKNLLNIFIVKYTLLYVNYLYVFAEDSTAIAAADKKFKLFIKIGLPIILSIIVLIAIVLAALKNKNEKNNPKPVEDDRPRFVIENEKENESINEGI